MRAILALLIAASPAHAQLIERPLIAYCIPAANADLLQKIYGPNLVLEMMPSAADGSAPFVLTTGKIKIIGAINQVGEICVIWESGKLPGEPA